MRETGCMYLLLLAVVTLTINSAYACQNYDAPNCEIESDGYYPHEHLCNHFYLCANGYRSLLKCSDDQVFDTDNFLCRSGITCDERCIEPIDYIQCPETPECELNDFGRLLPYPPDCTLYIYCEEDGSESISICPPGLHFSADLEGCVDPVEAKCPKCVTLTTTTEATTTIAVCPATADCTPDMYGYLIAYPPDCSMYYYCDEFGEAIKSICPTGLHFNETIQGCVDPIEANCPYCEVTKTTIEIPLSSTTVESTATTTDIPTSTTLTTTELVTTTIASTTELVTTTIVSTTEIPTTAEIIPTTDLTSPKTTTISTTDVPTTTEMFTTIPICDEVPTCEPEEEGNMKPYPPDCRRYIYCNGRGDEIISKCPAFKEFSPSLLECLPPNEANCPRCEITTEEITTTTVITTSTIAECPATPTCAIGEEGVLKEYPPQCTRYIYCFDNASYSLRKCPAGKEFSPTMSKCMTPELAGCPYCELTTFPTTIESTAEITSTTELTSTSAIDITTDTTLTTQLAECPPLYACTILDVGDFKPYPQDCQYYIVCTGKNKYRLTKCLFGRHFSPILEGCVDPEVAGCPNCFEATTATQSTTELTSTPEVDTTTDSTTLSSTITTETTYTTQLPECPPLYACTILDVGDFKPYPQDCQYYIVCTGRNTYRKTKCLFGRHFSPTLEGCADPEIAGCPKCSEATTSTPSTTEFTSTTPSTTELTSTSEVDTTTDSTPITTTLSSTITTETTYTTQLPECPPLYACTILDVGEFKPYPEDCQYYIVCTGRNTYRKTKCLFGRHFSPTLEGCADPEVAGCPNCSVATTPIITTTVEITTTEETTSTTEYTTSVTETIPPCKELRSCVDYPIGTLLPVPSNCSLYIYCNGNVGRLSSCAPGFQFDESSQSCEPSERVVCVSCEPLSTESTTDIWSTTTESATTIPPCPDIPTCDDVPEGTNLPYPTNCSMYIYCGKSGEEKISYCRPGYHFSMETGFCVPAEQANCPLCYEITTTTIETTTIPICPDTPECQLEEYDTWKPYPPDCKNYVYCDGFTEGPGEIRHCSPGKLYDHVTAKCVNPTVALCPYCIVLTTTVMSTTQEFTTTTSSNSNSETPQSTTDSSTTLLEETSPSTTPVSTTPVSTTPDSTTPVSTTPDSTTPVSTTPVSTTLVFSSTTDITSSTTYVETTTEYVCPTQRSCNGTFTLGDNYPIVGNCTHYIYCDGVGNQIRPCPVTQFFDYKEEWCMDKAIAFCPDCSTSTSTSEEVTSSTEPTTPPAIPICPPTPTCGMFDVGLRKEYPPDCSKYILCTTMQEEIRNCPTDEHFSPTMKTCLLIANAGCPLCNPPLNSNNMWSYIRGLLL